MNPIWTSRSPRSWRTIHGQLLAVLSFSGLGLTALAAPPAWLASPADNNWNNPANWNPNTVPNGQFQAVILGATNTPNIVITADSQVGTIEFSSSSPAYTLKPNPLVMFAVTDNGAFGANGTYQTFEATGPGPGGAGNANIVFRGGSYLSSPYLKFVADAALAAGQPGGAVLFAEQADIDLTQNVAQGALFPRLAANDTTGGGTFSFLDTTIGRGIAVQGGAAVNANGGSVLFRDSSRATEIVAQGAAFAGATGGQVLVQNNATLGATVGGGTAAGAGGGQIHFMDNAAGSVTINGGTSGGAGGSVLFSGTASSGSVVVNGSTDDGLGGIVTFAESSVATLGSITAGGGTSSTSGGLIVFRDTATAANSIVTLSGNGRLDISQLTTSGLALRGFSGAGFLDLGSKNLTISGGGISSFNGAIRDGGLGGGTGGSLTKNSSGTLTLGGQNTYTGATTVNGGTLQVASFLTGPAIVGNSATLTGSGALADVTLQSGGVFSLGNFTAASLTVNDGGVLSFVLGTTGLQLQLSGTLLKVGTNPMSIRFTDANSHVGQTYPLMSFADSNVTLPSDFMVTSDSPYTGYFTLQPHGGGKELDFTIQTTTTPEPSSAIILLLGAALLGGRARFARGRPAVRVYGWS